MAGKPSPVTPAVLSWAVDEDGRHLAELSEALKVDVDVLDSWVHGEQRPTTGDVTRLADVVPDDDPTASRPDQASDDPVDDPERPPARLPRGVGYVSHDRVSIADVAHLTGVPAGTVRRWISKGRLHGTGKPHKVSVSEVVGLRNLLARRAEKTRFGGGQAG